MTASTFEINGCGLVCVMLILPSILYVGIHTIYPTRNHFGYTEEVKVYFWEISQLLGTPNLHKPGSLDY